MIVGEVSYKKLIEEQEESIKNLRLVNEVEMSDTRAMSGRNRPRDSNLLLANLQPDFLVIDLVNIRNPIQNSKKHQAREESRAVS